MQPRPERRGQVAPLLVLGASLVSSFFVAPAQASDACAQAAVYSKAAVTVSDGQDFMVETWFGDTSHAAVRHHRDSVQTMAVEGPFSWAENGEKSQLGEEFWKAFALGHQYHALFVSFEELLGPVDQDQSVTFDGKEMTAIGADYPFGGRIYRVGEADRPAGILMQLPDSPPIESRFGDWREQEGRWLPFTILIDDGQATFDYRYETVSIGEDSATWYLDQVAQPALDEIALYRMHRRLLAAHCDGDANIIADLSLDEVTMSNRGELSRATREETRERFESVFAQVDYRRYVDLVPPRITVSEAGDIGWIAVQVQSAGVVVDSAEPFDYQWSWVMFARKENGQWRHAGNASNLAPVNRQD